MSDFRFDEPIDPSLFSTDIPEGYAVDEQPKPPRRALAAQPAFKRTQRLLASAAGDDMRYSEGRTCTSAMRANPSGRSGPYGSAFFLASP